MLNIVVDFMIAKAGKLLRQDITHLQQHFVDQKAPQFSLLYRSTSPRKSVSGLQRKPSKEDDSNTQSS